VYAVMMENHLEADVFEVQEILRENGAILDGTH
jgi:hypothetical protein